MSFDPQDAFTGGTSNCCGARIYLGDLCSSCGEHCSEQEDEEEDDAPTDGSDTYRRLKDAEAHSINREARRRRKS